MSDPGDVQQKADVHENGNIRFLTATLEFKEKCPRWDSNPHCPLFESGLSNRLEYWGLRKEGELQPLAHPPYRS